MIWLTGTLQNRRGVVLHIHQAFYAFLHNRDIPQNGGIFVARCRSLEPIAPKGGTKAAVDLSKMNPALLNAQGGAPSMSRGPRDRLVGVNVVIVKGPQKGYLGAIKDVNGDHCRVELNTTNKIVTVEKVKLRRRGYVIPLLPLDLVTHAWHLEWTERSSHWKTLGAASSRLVRLAVRPSPHGAHPRRMAVHLIRIRLMAGERLAGDKTEVELLVGVPRAGHRIHTPAAKPQLGVPTRKHPTLTMVEKLLHGIPRLGRPTPTAMVVGHLDGTPVHEHRTPTPTEDALQVGVQALRRLIRMPAQVRIRTLLVQTQLGASLRVVLLQAGNNRQEMLITIVGVLLQLRTSG